MDDSAFGKGFNIMFYGVFILAVILILCVGSFYGFMAFKAVKVVKACDSAPSVVVTDDGHGNKKYSLSCK